MTASGLTFDGRLPGVVVDVTLPEREAPVRLDVAAFVGFAERGPLHTPVALDDPNGYRTVFGGDLVLAFDGGRPVLAQLAAAVRAFFENGGRRCWVVRVAGPQARAARWPVPGLRVVDLAGVAHEVVVDAAWAGAWSAGIQLATSVTRRALPHGPAYQRIDGDASGQLVLPIGAAGSVADGDLLELDLGEGLPHLYVRTGARRTTDAGVQLDVLRELAGPRVEPGAVAGLPSVTPLLSVRLVRFDLRVDQVVDGEARLLERRTDLGLGSWPDALQPPDAGAPVPGRSLVLRASRDTTSLVAAGGLVVPDATDTGGAPPIDRGDDDLATFDPVTCFLDPHVASDTVASLVAHIDALTSLSPHPVALRGIHALAAVDEVGLVACPDLGHRQWVPAVPPVEVIVPEPPPEHPDWSDFRCCLSQVSSPPVEAPPVVETSPPAPSSPPQEPHLELVDPRAYDPAPAQGVQVALVTLCAALADRVALLSLPAHFDAPDALAWQVRLAQEPALGPDASVVPLAYATLWHPWLLLSADASIPPDGPVAGMVAARELRRGVWVAPAAVPLRGPVAFAGTPLADADVRRLFDAHLNVIRQGPNGFAALSAHTLADAPWLQLSVRRTVSWLRKLVLRAGRRYVFEVADDRFVAMVARRFESLLAQLTAAGAFHAARVEVAGPSPDPAADAQVVVNLHVAPSSPVEFITITLLRTGDGLLELGAGS